MTPPPIRSDQIIDAVDQKKGYVYLLRSQKDKKFYLGWTTDVNRRLEEHNKGINLSTKSRIPYELIYFETLSSIELAKQRERVLKKNPNMYFYFKRKAMSFSLVPKSKGVVG